MGSAVWLRGEAGGRAAHGGASQPQQGCMCPCDGLVAGLHRAAPPPGPPLPQARRLDIRLRTPKGPGGENKKDYVHMLNGTLSGGCPAAWRWGRCAPEAVLWRPGALQAAAGRPDARQEQQRSPGRSSSSGGRGPALQLAPPVYAACARGHAAQTARAAAPDSGSSRFRPAATSRTLCCLLENYQTPDGVRIPEVLQPFMMGMDFIPFRQVLPWRARRRRTSRSANRVPRITPHSQRSLIGNSHPCPGACTLQQTPS